MKEKRTKKESIKKETEKESSNVTAFVSENDSKRSPRIGTPPPRGDGRGPLKKLNNIMKTTQQLIQTIEDIFNDYRNSELFEAKANACADASLFMGEMLDKTDSLTTLFTTIFKTPI